MKYSRRILIIPDAQITPDVVKSVTVLADAGGTSVLKDGESSRSIGRPIRGARYRHYQRENIIDSVKNGRARSVTMVVDRLGETDSRPKLFRSDTVVGYRATPKELHQFEPISSTSAKGGGELLPEMSGDPTDDFKGNLMVTSPGFVGDARFSWNTAEEIRDGKHVPGDANFRQSPNVFGSLSSVLNTVEGQSSPGSGGVSSDSATGSLEQINRYLCRPKVFNMPDGEMGCVYLGTSLPPHHWQLASNMDPSSSDISSRTEALSSKLFFQKKSSAGVWSAPVDLTDSELYPGLVKDDDLEEIAFADCIVDPITDELVCIVGKNVPDVQSANIYVGGELSFIGDSKNLGQSSFCTGKYASTRTIMVITSSDRGQSWGRRSSCSSESDPTRLSGPDSGIPGMPSRDIGLILGGSCEIMDSGRLVIALVTAEAVYLVSSDDMGKTFKASQVKRFAHDSAGSSFNSIEKKEPKVGLNDGDSWVVGGIDVVKVHGVFHNNPAPLNTFANINATSPDGRVFHGGISGADRTGWELHVEEMRSTPPRFDEVESKPGAVGNAGNIVYSKIYAIGEDASGEWSGYSGHFAVAYRTWHPDTPNKAGWIMPLGVSIGNVASSWDNYNRFSNAAPGSGSTGVTVLWSTAGYAHHVVPTNFSREDEPWNWLIVQPGAGWHFNPGSINNDRTNVMGIVTPSPGRYFFVKHGEYAGSRVFIEGNRQRDPSIALVFDAPSSPSVNETVLVGGVPTGFGADNIVGYLARWDGTQWRFQYQTNKFVVDGRAVLIVGDSPFDTDAFAGHENRFCLLQSGGLAPEVESSNVPGQRLISDHVGFWTKFSDPGEVTAIISNEMIPVEPTRVVTGSGTSGIAGASAAFLRDPEEGRVRSQASQLAPGGPLIHMDGVWVEDEDVGRFLRHSGEIATYNEQDDSWSFELPPDGYYAKDAAGDTYVFDRASRNWTKVEDPESEPAFVLAAMTRARETVSNTSITKAPDGRLFFAVAYTDFSDTVNINPLTNYWIQDDLLGNTTSQGDLMGSDFSYPFVMEDRRKVLVSYASRRMEVYETTDGETSRLVDGWVNSVKIDDVECFSTNVASHDGVLSYSVHKGGIIGSGDLPYGPCVIEPCVVVRPDGRLQVYGASHNWLPPQYEGLHNDSHLNSSYISSVSGTAYRSKDSMGAAVINGMASATIDINGEGHRLNPSVNLPCSRNAVAPGDLVYDDQFSSSALSISNNGLSSDPEDNSGSPSLRRRAHARKLDTRRATAAFLANPIASGLGSGLISPGLVSVESPNGIVYNMSFMWGVYPRRPSISVESTKSVSRYSNISTETVLSVGRVEKLSADRLGGIDFVAIDKVSIPPLKIKSGDVYLVAALDGFNDAPSGAFADKSNNLATYEAQSDGTMGWTFRSRFPANSKVMVLSEGRDGVYTAVITNAATGPNIGSWDRGLVNGSSTLVANISWSSGDVTFNDNAAIAGFTVVTADYNHIDNNTYIKYSGGINVGRHLLHMGVQLPDRTLEIITVHPDYNIVVVKGGGVVGTGPVVGQTYNVVGREATISSSGLYNSGSHSDVSIGDYVVVDAQVYYVSESPLSSTLLKVVDRYYDPDLGTLYSNPLESASSVGVYSPGDLNVVYDVNAVTQQVYWHSDNSGNLPKRPANQFAGFVGGYSGMDAVLTDSGISVVSSKIYQKTFGNGSPKVLKMTPAATPGFNLAAWHVDLYSTQDKTLLVYRGDSYLFSCKVHASTTQSLLCVTLCDYENFSPRSLTMSPDEASLKIYVADTTQPTPTRLAGGASQLISTITVDEYFGGDRRFLRSISQYSQKDDGGVEFGFRAADSSSITENRTFYWHPIRENLGRTDSASSIGGNTHWEETAIATDTYIHQENMSHSGATSVDILNRRFRLIGGRYYSINWFGDASPSSAGMTVHKGLDPVDSTATGHLSIVNAGSTESGKVYYKAATGLRQRTNVLDAGGGFHISDVKENTGGFKRQAVLAEPDAYWGFPVLDRQNSPPSSVSLSDRYLVGDSPSGAWSSNANDIAEWSGSSWIFTSPSADDAVDIQNADTDAESYIWDGSAWNPTVKETAIRINDTLFYEDNGTQRVATVVSDIILGTGYKTWRPGYFSTYFVEDIPETDPLYSTFAYGQRKLVRIGLTVSNGLTWGEDQIAPSDAIRLTNGGPFFEIEDVREVDTLTGKLIYIYVIQTISQISGGYPPFNILSAAFLPPSSPTTSAANVEIRHTITLDYGYGVTLPYDQESNTTILMNFHTPAEDSLVSLGRIPLDFLQLEPSEYNGKYISPRLPSGASTGNLYEVTDTGTSRAHLDVSTAYNFSIQVTRVTTFSAPRTSGITNPPPPPGGIFFGDWDYSFTKSSSTFDSGNGQTTIIVGAYSGLIWSHLSESTQKYITGKDSLGDVFTYQVVSSTEASSTIVVSGTTDASHLTGTIAIHTVEAGGIFWGDTALNAYDGSLPFKMLTMVYDSANDALSASFVMDEPNYSGLPSLQDKFYLDKDFAEVTSNAIMINTIATNGSRITDEQSGFMFDVYSAETAASVAAMSEANGGAAFTVTKDTYSIASIGTGVNDDGIQIGNRLPFPNGFGCAPVHESLNQTHHADPYAGGFRAIFAPINTNEEISGDSSSTLSSNIFFSMLLHGSSWKGYRGNQSSGGVAGLVLRAKLQSFSTYKEVVIELVDGAQELRRYKVEDGEVLDNDAPEVLGKTTIRCDGIKELNFVEVLVGMEAAHKPNRPDEAPIASIVHAFARPVDAEGKSNRSFSTICNYKRLQHSTLFSTNPFISPISSSAGGSSVETILDEGSSGNFNMGAEHFCFGVSARGLRTMARPIGATATTSGIGMVVKQVSVHRPGNSISGSGLVALNSDLNGSIETITAPIYDKSVYGTQFTELKPIQVAGTGDANFASGDVFTRGSLSGLEQCGINPSSILNDTDSSCSLMSAPHFLGTFGEELSVMDAGVVNPNRGGLCSSSPQDLISGIKVSWRGNSTTKSTYALSTYYDYSFKNAFEQNLAKMWSTGTSPENDSLNATYHSGKSSGRSYQSRKTLFTVPSVQIVLDSQGDHGDAASGDLVLDVEHQIRSRSNFFPDGVAVFGRNWGSCRLEFCDNELFDPNYGSYRKYEIGQPGDSWATDPDSTSLVSDPERYSHLWAWTNRDDTRVSPARTPVATGTGNSKVGFGDRTFFYNADVTNHTTADENSPWIPHQFRSTENGAKFYLQVVCRKVDSGSAYASTGNKLVFKILDNTEDRLILDTNPLKCLDAAPGTGESSGSGSMPWHTVSIFSDRFALQLYNYSNSTTGSPTTQSKSGTQSHNLSGVGFRFMRITVNGATRLSQSESSHKLGRIVLGKVKSLAGPDFEWGWSRRESSGTNLTTFNGGQRVARKVHEPRREFNVSHAPLMPKHTVRSGQSIWEATSRGFGSGSGELYKHSARTWNEVLEMLRMLGFGSVQAALVFDDASNALASKGSSRDWVTDAATNYDEISYVTVPSEPSNLMLVRMTKVGEISHEGYVCRDVRIENQSVASDDGNGSSSVFGSLLKSPAPAMKISQITFEEEL